MILVTGLCNQVSRGLLDSGVNSLEGRCIFVILIGQMNRIRSIYIKTIEIAPVITGARSVCGR